MTRSLSLVVGILLLGAAIAYPVVRRDTLVPTSSGMLVNGPLVVTGEVEFDAGQSLGTGTVTSTEILDDTIDGVDLADSIAMDAATVAFTGNFALTLGDSTTDSVTVTTDGTGTGELVLPAESVAAGEITNLVRSVPLPIWAWVPCALETGGIWDASGADAEPDLTNTPAGTVAITYDDTGGSIDTGTICTSFIVPADYASGGAFRARVTQDAATTNIETFSCAISVDGAALGAANAGNNVSQTAVQTVTATPAGTWAAGASIQVACSQGNASADDVVNIHGIEAFYTATQ